jgi:hypothetical protein
MRWSIHVDAGPVPPSRLLALELSPRLGALRLEPVVVGHGSPEVGQLLVYRRHYPGARVGPGVQPWLASATAHGLLHTVHTGFSATMHWTGDGIGHWTPEAWSAAETLFYEIGEHLILVEDA